ncbi:MAG: (2Fe-2S) ferredoxin domain-containing protein, partial [Proteobacteria bacterium]|nr:(2Fe-2S) ferredoxin domain-containing protein [Pseudomonadota bacterium]
MKIKDPKVLADAKKKAQSLLFPGKVRISVGTASCGLAKGAKKTLNALKAGIASHKIDARVVAVGCNGLCHREPIVEVHIPGKAKVVYGPVTENDVPALLQAISKNDVIENRAIVAIDAEEHVLEGAIKYAEPGTDDNMGDIPSLKEYDYLRLQ